MLYETISWRLRWPDWLHVHKCSFCTRQTGLVSKPYRDKRHQANSIPIDMHHTSAMFQRFGEATTVRPFMRSWQLFVGSRLIWIARWSFAFMPDPWAVIDTWGHIAKKLERFKEAICLYCPDYAHSFRYMYVFWNTWRFGHPRAIAIPQKCKRLPKIKRYLKHIFWRRLQWI